MLHPNARLNDYDVVVVGAGLTGLFLTHLLLNVHGIAPDRILLLEKQSRRYHLPRAAGFGDDNARLYRSCLPRASVDRSVARIIGPGFQWQWLDRHGEVLYDAQWNAVGKSGYDVRASYLNSEPSAGPVARISSWLNALQAALPPFNRKIIQGFHQPWLEDSMEELILGRSKDIIRFSHAVIGMEENASGVLLKVAVKGEDGPREQCIQTSWVVGADSANSTIRRLAGIEWLDSGFVYDWLVADLLPNEETLRHLNSDVGYFQKCDPKRPSTCVWSGPGRRRFEFMRLPGESKEELREKTWQLLEEYGIDDSMTSIERSAVYTFRACIVDRFVSGRCILAGDAAHLTPPFLGQGAQMGIRDAANLAWRLSLVTKGLANSDLIKDYSSERREPCKFLIDLAVKVGTIICVATPEEADAKHAKFRNTKAEQVGDPPLGGPGQFSKHPSAGHLSLHRPVKMSDGKTALLDDILEGPGWLLLGWQCDPLQRSTTELSVTAIKTCKTLALKSVRLDTTIDTTGDWETWFREEVRDDVVLVRPDFYIADACNHAGVTAMLENMARLCRLQL